MVLHRSGNDEVFGAGAAVRAGLEAYVRDRLLPRLVAIDPQMLADRTRRGRAAVIAALERALAGERRRGRAGHWSYRLDRHIGLAQALAAERRALIEACSRRRSEG